MNEQWCPLFTQEQWIEIYEARARLEAWRCKFQPYPAYPEETSEPEKQIIHIHTHLSLDKKALELQERIVSLEENLKTFNERKNKFSSYIIK